jgi:hypothetical protein
MRIGGEIRITRRKLTLCHFVHYKSHMTWNRLEAGDYPP